MSRGHPLRSALLGLALLAACDWDYYALTNSIPLEGDPRANPVVHVMLGVDGLAFDLASEAQDLGAFPGWHRARHVTGFPGTSDVAWSRILHSEPTDSYEYQFFDPEEDQLVRGGYAGVLMHAVPLAEKPCYRSFDFTGNGLSNGLYNYEAPQYSLAVTLDNVFTLVEGRAQSRSTEAFLGFVIELDVIGHMQGRAESLEALLTIDRRIAAFQAAHPERTWVFTVVSDHGHNFVASPGERMIRFQDELPKAGVEVVGQLAGRDPQGPLVAVPIVHTRVTYLSLHTLVEQAPEVARRVSGFAFADLAVARLPPPGDAPASPERRWYGLWRDGALALRFGYDVSSDRYLVDRRGTLEPLGLGVFSGEGWGEFADEELFAATLGQDYPDLLYRTRTALEPVGIRYPAQVLLSFRQPFASIGFEIPGGANEIASASFHGAMHRLDTLGVVLTQSHELPPAIRSDAFLDLFPAFRSHLEARGLLRAAGDPGQGLDYGLVWPAP